MTNLFVITDLIPGVQVEFNDKTLNITSYHGNHELPRGVLISHVCKWRYKYIKFIEATKRKMTEENKGGEEAATLVKQVPNAEVPIP
jgi:hypothetical protein